MAWLQAVQAATGARAEGGQWAVDSAAIRQQAAAHAEAWRPWGAVEADARHQHLWLAGRAQVPGCHRSPDQVGAASLMVMHLLACSASILRVRQQQLATARGLWSSMRILQPVVDVHWKAQ